MRSSASIIAAIVDLKTCYMLNLVTFLDCCEKGKDDRSHGVVVVDEPMSRLSSADEEQTRS